MTPKEFSSNEAKSTVIVLDEFSKRYENYRGKTIILKDCPVVVTPNMLSDRYYIFVRPNSGITIYYQVVGEKSNNIKKIHVTDYVATRMVDQGIKNNSFNLVLPHVSYLSKSLVEFNKKTKEAIKYHQNLLQYSTKKLVFIEDIVKKYPELVI